MASTIEWSVGLFGFAGYIVPWKAAAFVEILHAFMTSSGYGVGGEQS